MKAEFYHYHFGRNTDAHKLAIKINRFAKGKATVEPFRGTLKAQRIHCKHSCVHFRQFGAYAVRGDYIVYNKAGHLQHVMSPELFHEHSRRCQNE